MESEIELDTEPDTKPDTERLCDLGEAVLLDRLRPFCAPGVVGDDAALLAWGNNRDSLVVTTDVLVANVHFSDRTTPPHAIGARAAAANLSDLAAMGATPLALTVGLSLPGETTWAWLAEVYRGLREWAEPWGAPIVGGDVTRSPVAILAITALGSVDPAVAIRRNQARPGDAIVVTGPHGAARAGLEVLLHPDSAGQVNASQRAAWIRAHQYPQPRLDAIALRPPGVVVAGMDSSDGLADALVQLAGASGVVARVDRRALPLPAGLAAWRGEAGAIDWALYGGEDFELVLCLPAAAAQGWVDRLGGGAAIVGEILPAGAAGPAGTVWLFDSWGQEPIQPVGRDRAFRHF